MKTILLSILISFLLSSCRDISKNNESQNTSTAYNVIINTPKECWVSLINEQDAKSGKYGWWSIWHDQKSAGLISKTPYTFYNVTPGRYVLVVYNPASKNYDPNSGKLNERSDGVVIENINIDGKSIYKFNLEQKDFKDWNCLSCPWLYLYDGKEFVKLTEVLKDVIGEKNCLTDFIAIPNSYIINNKLKILLKEEKEEITFIDGVSLLVDDEEIISTLSEVKALTFDDNEYFELRKSQSIELTFNLREFTNIKGIIQLKIRGYYEPEESFVQRYLEDLK